MDVSCNVGISIFCEKFYAFSNNSENLENRCRRSLTTFKTCEKIYTFLQGCGSKKSEYGSGLDPQNDRIMIRILVKFWRLALSSNTSGSGFVLNYGFGSRGGIEYGFKRICIHSPAFLMMKNNEFITLIRIKRALDSLDPYLPES